MARKKARNEFTRKQEEIISHNEMIIADNIFFAMKSREPYKQYEKEAEQELAALKAFMKAGGEPIYDEETDTYIIPPEPEPTQKEAQKDDPTATLERRQKVKQIADRYEIHEETNHGEYLERLVLCLADELDKATAAAASFPEPMMIPEKRKTGRPQVLDEATIQQVLELRRHGISYPLIAERISESGTQVSREMIRRICTAHGVKTPQEIRQEAKKDE